MAREVASACRKPGGVAGRRQVQPGDKLEYRHVPHTVMAGAVRSGYAGAIQREGYAAAVQGDIHQQLVEGAVEKRRVDRDHRMQPTHGQSRGRGDRVLLGYANIEDSVREKPGQIGGGRSDRSSRQ